MSDGTESLSTTEYAVAAAILLGAVLVLVYLLPSEILVLGGFIIVLSTVIYGLTYLLVTSERELLDRTTLSPVWLVFLVPVGISPVFVRVFELQLPLTNGILFVALLLSVFTYWLVIPAALYQHVQDQQRTVDIDEWPPIAVLVPAYNEEGYVGRCIDSFLDAEYPSDRIELIVVDDGSTDRTYQEAVEHANELVTVLQKENGGKHSALNYALQRTTSELIVCIDADSKIRPESLKELVRTYESRPEACAIAGNVKVENPGSFITKLQSLEYVIGISMFRRALDVLGLINIVPGCLGMFDRNLVTKIGGYSEDTVTEDFDLSLSLLKEGKRIHHSSNAIVETEVPDTWANLCNQRLRWFRGNVQTVLKHMNVFTDSGFGLLHLVLAPYFLISMIIIPGLGFLVFGLIVWLVVTGSLVQFFGLFALFTLLQALFCTLAVLIEGEDLSLVWYAPLTVVGYKQFLDVLLAKGIFDVLTGRSIDWTHTRRIRQHRSPTNND